MTLDSNIKNIKDNVHAARLDYDHLIEELKDLKAELNMLKSEGGLYSRIGHMPGLREAKLWRDENNDWRMYAGFENKEVNLKYGQDLPTADTVYDDATGQLLEQRDERHSK